MYKNSWKFDCRIIKKRKGKKRKIKKLVERFKNFI